MKRRTTKSDQRTLKRGTRRAAIWRKVIGRDGIWLMLTCGHEVKTGSHTNGRPAPKRVCPICTRLEREKARRKPG